MPWLLLILVLLITLAVWCGILVLVMAQSLIQPMRMTDARANWKLKRLSPSDLGLPFEELAFHVRDERTGRQLKMAAWWIPSPASTRTVLLIHGYSDAKVGAIAWAPMLHSLGCNILAIDLRAHGESDGSFSTAGFWERHDVNQIINQFRQMRPRETESLAIFGISLGAAIAINVAAMRDDLAGVIMESPFGDYRRAIAAHGWMRGAPGGGLRDSAIRLAEWASASDFRAVRPQDALAKVRCPVMVIHAGNDPFIPEDDAAATDAALAARSNPRDVRWKVEGAGHVLGLVAGVEEYRQRVGAFLNQSGTGASPVQLENDQHGRGARATIEEAATTPSSPSPPAA